jgi:general secretion pathway protein M
MKKIIFALQRRRAILFITGNLVFCGLVIGIIVMPVLSFFADREGRIDQQRRVLARLTAIAAQASSIQSIVSDTKAQIESGEFLTGANENVISADLQTRLKAMTEAVGARPRAVQALPGQTVGLIRYTGSRLEISGSLQSIVRSMHAIESSKPYLFITGAVLKIIPPTRQGVAEEPIVQAQLDIVGATRLGGQP